jgi:xanthine dehydrogenase small subunit
MAGTPKRAPAAEAALIGQVWNWDSVQLSQGGLANDYQPLSDWRASADYRMRAAQNLITRFFLETAGAPARLERSPETLEA